MSEPASPPPRPRALRVFVNERGVDVAPGATALDAVRAHDAAEGGRVAGGERQITDSRGLPVPPDAAAYGGAIYRTVAARRAAAGDADAPRHGEGGAS
jgi:hypothetical protein